MNTKLQDFELLAMCAARPVQGTNSMVRLKYSRQCFVATKVELRIIWDTLLKLIKNHANWYLYLVGPTLKELWLCQGCKLQQFFGQFYINS